jgi:hypothetical protein
MSCALMVAGAEVAGRVSERLGAVLYIDYEDDGEEWARRWDGLLLGAGYAGQILPVHRWRPRKIALADQMNAIRTKVQREGIVLVIVDSATPACGDRPEEAEYASRYFSALGDLGTGVGSITIAHQTKGARELKDQSSPFGSTQWRDRARRVWLSALAEQHDPAVLNLTLVCKKNNRGRRPPPFGVRISFSDIEYGGDGAISLEWRDPRLESDPALTEELPLRDRMWAALVTPMSDREVLDALNLEPRQLKQVQTQLRRWRGRLFGKAGAGEKWGRLEREENV